ncbi:MAG: hypothetical protein JNG84_06065, partial [Archangium sp.]|nr:hypothetical protein [Archangium sp.]
MTRGPSCPPKIELQRVAAGEPVPGIEAHLPTCDDCRNFVDQQKNEALAFARARPPELFLSQLER